MNKKKPLFLSLIILFFSVLLSTVLVLSLHEVKNKSVLFVSYDRPVTTLDPVKATTELEKLVITNSWDGLFEWTFIEGAREKLVDKWQISSDGMRYIFSLKEGLLFQDGEPVDSNAVKYTLDRLKMSDVFNKIVKVTTLSTRVIEVTLNQIDPLFITKLSYYSAKIVKKNDLGEWVGVGPFQPKIVPNGVILNVSKMYQKLSSFSQILILKKFDLNSRVDMNFDGNEKDIPGYKSMQWPVSDTGVLWFKNAEMSKKINKYIQAEEFIKAIQLSLDPAVGLIPFGMAGYINPVDYIKAKRIKPEVRSKKRIEIYFPINAFDKEKIQGWLSIVSDRLGIELVSRFKSEEFIKNNIKKSLVDAAFIKIPFQYSDSFMSLHSILHHPFLSFIVRSTPSLINEVKSALQMPDSLQRDSIAKKINIHLVETQSYVPLFHYQNKISYRSCLKNIKLHSLFENSPIFRELKSQCY